MYGYKSNFSFFSRIWEEGPCKPLRNFFRLFSLTRFSIFILSCAHFINVSGATCSSLAASIIVHSPLIYRSYALLNPSGVIPFVISFSSLNSDSSLASKNANINKKQLSCFPKPRQPFLNYSRLFCSGRSKLSKLSDSCCPAHIRLLCLCPQPLIDLIDHLPGQEFTGRPDHSIHGIGKLLQINDSRALAYSPAFSSSQPPPNTAME